MAKQQSHGFTCPICGNPRSAREALPGEIVRPAIVSVIQKEHPEWTPEQPLCLPCLHRYRNDYVEQMLKDEKGELSAVEKEVVESLRQHEVVAENVNENFDSTLTFGEHLADRIAEFGGSWTFISIFGGVLLGWIAINSLLLLRRPFDPYPYILLNLVLSCLAAIQAPVIMMSQNRQESKDRLRAEHDYQVNLKAELEIRMLNEKMDLLLTHQWQRLLEIQRVQVELMEELAEQRSKRGAS
jgi:uncharacterized membrane protein